MKKSLMLLSICTILGCGDKEVFQEGNFMFVSTYCATVTVGGVLGITEKCFEPGDVVEGIDKGDESITIRIAEHTERNEGPPSSSSYQEFLDVPRKYLIFVE